MAKRGSVIFVEMKKLVVLGCCLLLSATSLAAEPSAEEVLKRADAILAPNEFEADFRLTHHRGADDARTFSMHLWKKGTEKMRIRFNSPPDDRGSEVLRDGENMWNYLPNLKRALKISPKQEFHGGDFNNTDILRVNLAADYTATHQKAERPDEYLLELKARDESVSYDRVRYWIRKKDFMPLRQEFYTQSGKLIRKLELSDVKAFGRVVRPATLVMKNMLVPTRHTELRYDTFVVKQSLDPNLFSLSVLGR